MKKAVALKYPEGAIAPIIVAKGQGKQADQIIAEAEKNNVTLVEDLQVVNLLESEKIGTVIPEETWKLVAIIFSFIMDQKKE